MSEQAPTELSASRIQPVIDQLRKLTHDQVGVLLDAKHDADPAAGIAIVNLEGETVTPDGAYHYHGARVFTSSLEHPNYVKPHYHNVGEEPYVILKGNEGEMNLGRVIDGKVVWKRSRTVTEGEAVVVQEGEVHSLRNTGTELLDFVFACPDSHLVDHSAEKPDGDRYFTMDIPDGIPSQYPKSS